MSIIRKWASARAEFCEEDGPHWIAETRANTGTWVIRDCDEGDRLSGLMVTFDESRPGVLLAMTDAQREEVGMSTETLVELEVQLRRDYERRQQRRLTDPSIRVTLPT